jgi:hypothetical protein
MFKLQCVFNHIARISRIKGVLKISHITLIISREKELGILDR